MILHFSRRKTSSQGFGGDKQRVRMIFIIHSAEIVNRDKQGVKKMLTALQHTSS